MSILIAYALYTFKKYKDMPPVTESEKIIALSDTTFDKELGNKLVLVDFWASWCVPCKMMAPVLNELSNEVDPSTSIAKVNVEQYQNLAARFKIRSIPTMVLFRNGSEIQRFVGVKSKDFLKKQILNQLN
jgi:thioredoxin 1